MRDSPVTLGDVIAVGSLIMGIEFVHGDIALIGGLVLLDQLVEVGHDLVVRDREFPEHRLPHILAQLGLPGAFHVFADVGLLRVSQFALDIGQRVDPGRGFLLLGGFLRQSAPALRVIAHGLLPLRLRGGFQLRLLVVRQVRHAELRRLLVIQRALDGPVQARGLQLRQHAFIRRIVSVGAVIAQVIVDQRLHFLVVAPDFIAVHGSQQHGLLFRRQVSHHGRVRPLRQGTRQAAAQQPDHKQQRRQLFAPVIVIHASLLSGPDSRPLRVL